MNLFILYLFFLLSGTVSAIPGIYGQKLQLALSAAAMVTIFGWQVMKTGQKAAMKAQEQLLQEIDHTCLASYSSTSTTSTSLASATTAFRTTVEEDVIETCLADATVKNSFAVLVDESQTIAIEEKVVEEEEAVVGRAKDAEGLSHDNTAFIPNNTQATMSMEVASATVVARSFPMFTINLQERILHTFESTFNAFAKLARRNNAAERLTNALLPARILFGGVFAIISRLVPSKPIRLITITLVFKVAAQVYETSPCNQRYSIVLVAVLKCLYGACLAWRARISQHFSDQAKDIVPTDGGDRRAQRTKKASMVDNLRSILGSVAGVRSFHSEDSGSERRPFILFGEAWKPKQFTVPGAWPVEDDEPRQLIVPGAWPVEDDELSGGVVDRMQAPVVELPANEAVTATSESEPVPPAATAHVPESHSAPSSMPFRLVETTGTFRVLVSSECVPPSTPRPGQSTASVNASIALPRRASRTGIRQMIPASQPCCESWLPVKPAVNVKPWQWRQPKPAVNVESTANIEPLINVEPFVNIEHADNIKPTEDVRSQQGAPAPPPAPTDQQPSIDNGPALEQPRVMQEEVAST